MQTVSVEKKFHRVIIGSFHLLLMVTPFLFTWFNEELFEFNKMLFVYAMTIIIGGSWITKTIIFKKTTFKHSFFSLLLLIFLATQVISSFFSIHIPTSLFGYYTRFNGGLFSIFSYSILYFVALQEISKKEVGKLIATLGFSSLAVALFALPEHFGRAWSCVFIRQEFSTSCWVQDVQNRIFGTFGQPNWLAAYTVTLIPIIINNFAFSANFFPKTAGKNGLTTLSSLTPLLLLFVAPLLFLTLLFTKSRSGFLGLIIAFSILVTGSVLIWAREKKPAFIFKSIPLRVVFTNIAIFLMIAFIFGTPFSKGWWEPNNSQISASSKVVDDRLEKGGTDSGEIRKIVWQGALNVWQRYPIVGSGVETFAYSYYQDRPQAHNLVSEWDFLYNKAHNEFLNYLATTGALGLTAFLLLHGWWIWVGVKVIWEKNNYDLPMKASILGFMSGIAALSVTNFFGFSTVMVSVLFYLFPAMVSVLMGTTDFSPLLLHSQEDSSTSLHSESVRSLQSLRPWQRYFLGASFITMMFFLAQLSITWLADYYFYKGKAAIRQGQTLSGITTIETAVKLRPYQPVFLDSLSSIYAQLAVGYAQQEATEEASLAASSAIETSNTALQLNPVHLVFYKTRIKVFSNLAQIQPEFLTQAIDTAQVALLLSPNDPKLWYQFGMLEIARGNIDVGVQQLQKSVELRPEYEQAQLHLAQFLTTQGKLQEAREHYLYVLEHLSPQNPVALDSLAIIEASLSSATTN